MIISVFDRVENIVGKGEIACTSNFSFSHNVFKRFLSQKRLKVSLCGNGLKLRVLRRLKRNRAKVSSLAPIVVVAVISLARCKPSRWHCLTILLSKFQRKDRDDLRSHLILAGAEIKNCTSCAVWPLIYTASFPEVFCIEVTLKLHFVLLILE